ncbi:hypothetical protein ACSSS7_007417 [Eimeria intestinalis]
MEPVPAVVRPASSQHRTPPSEHTPSLSHRSEGCLHGVDQGTNSSSASISGTWHTRRGPRAEMTGCNPASAPRRARAAQRGGRSSAHREAQRERRAESSEGREDEREIHSARMLSQRAEADCRGPRQERRQGAVALSRARRPQKQWCPVRRSDQLQEEQQATQPTAYEQHQVHEQEGNQQQQSSRPAAPYREHQKPRNHQGQGKPRQSHRPEYEQQQQGRQQNLSEEPQHGQGPTQMHPPRIQQQQQQPGQPRPARPAASRPQLSNEIPSVVVELHRLSRVYADSFRLLSCHPRLVLLLQKHTLLEKSGDALRAQVASLEARGHTDAGPAEGSRDATNSENSEAVGREGVEHADGYEGLCSFELVFTPTDPDFDATALPSGLRLHIRMGKDYPGSEEVLACALGKLAQSKEPGDASTACTQPFPREAVADLQDPAEEKPPHTSGGGPRSPLGQQSVEAAREPAEQKHSESTSTLMTGGSHFHAKASAGTSSSVASLLVCNREINDFRRNAIEMLFVKGVEKQLKAQQKADLVRSALRVLDRFLREIFEMAPNTSLTSKAEGQEAWTLLEQKRLEEAVILFRRVADPVLRWRNISNHVGNRTAKECAMRFKECRQNVLKQRESEAADEGGEGDSSSESPQSDSEDVESPVNARQEGQQSQREDAKPTLLRGCDISLLEPVTEGVASLHLSCVRVQVACGRCRNSVDVRVALPKDGETLETAGCSVDCEKCRLRMSVRVQPAIGICGSSLMRVASMEPCECLPKDLLPCDFILTCDCCGASMKAREVLSGESLAFKLAPWKAAGP